jgi:hypothetical protein
LIDAGEAFDDLVIALAFGRISREYFLAEAPPLVELYAATLSAELREVRIPSEEEGEAYLEWFAREGEKRRRALTREVQALRARQGGAPSTQPATLKPL